MRIGDLMSKPVVTCRSDDTLNNAARLMWEYDCGVVPVVKEDGRMAGIVTDRDICMAAYTQGKTLHDIAVSTAMAGNVFSCHADDSLDTAERLMKDKQVRRLPVLDGEGRPVGVLSVSDIARHAASSPGMDEVSRELSRDVAAICQPRWQQIVPKAPTMLHQKKTVPSAPRG